jgi:hypothetical protein
LEDELDLQKMMKQMQKAQEKMNALQEEVAGRTVEATAGGNMVRVVMGGDGVLHSIVIDPEVVDPTDVEMLQDLVVAAVNEGKRRTQELMGQEMQRLAGGMGLPPGML